MKTEIRFREVIKELGFPLKGLPDIFEVSPETCLLWWSEVQDFEITNVHFERIARYLGFDENQMYQGNYDISLARKRLFGDFRSLPDKYSENRNSFLRTSSHIIRYVRLTRGQLFADEVLSSLNVSPLIYQSPDTLINLNYFADLLENLSQRGFNQKEIDTLASVLFLSMQKTNLGEKFQAASSNEEVYQILAKNFDYFDSNFEYKSNFIKKDYVLRTTLNLSPHRSLKENPAKLKALLRYRHILLAWFPFLAGLPPRFPKVEVNHSKDVMTVTYKCDLSPLRQPLCLQTL